MTTNMPGSAPSSVPGSHQDVNDELVATAQSLLDFQATSAGTWITGTGAPGSGDGMLPLDGVNDPWRWNAARGWIGPACSVTWAEGDEVPGTTGALVDVFVGPWTTLGEAFAQNNGGFQGDGRSAAYLEQGMVASADGAGIAFIIQTEVEFGSHEPVVDLDLDVTTLLGDVTVGSAYTFPNVQTGADGQFYLDTDTDEVYGPRTAGDWGLVMGTLAEYSAPPAVALAYTPTGVDDVTGAVGALAYDDDFFYLKNELGWFKILLGDI